MKITTTIMDRAAAMGLVVALALFACGTEEESEPGPEEGNDPTCEAWCQASLAPLCAQGPSLAGCLDICVEDRDEYPDCADPYDALLECQTDAGFVCEGGIARSIGDCTSQKEAVDSCRLGT